MQTNNMKELYQQVILEHNRNPKNFKKLENPSFFAEGYNPLCGDRYRFYIMVDTTNTITELTFEGTGCAISKASASMMTVSLKGKNTVDVKLLFEQFQKLAKGELKPEAKENQLGKLNIFSGIWNYPSRVKCAILSWHALNNALHKIDKATTE